MLWDIISMSAGSLVWGVLISLLCMAMFVFIITSWWKDALFTVWSYVIGVVLFVLLAIQSTLIVGSLKVLDTVDEYEGYLTEIVDNLYASYEEVYVEETDALVKKVIERYPLLEYYVDGGEFEGYDARNLPAAMADEMRSFMRRYIVRRLMWCLGFVVFFGALGIWSLSRRYESRHYSDGRDRRTSHFDRQRPSTSGIGRRQHVNTRRR